MAPWPSGKAKVCNTSTPGPNPGGASKNKSTAREQCFCFWNDLFRKRNEICPSGVMFASQVMCASRVRRNTSHRFATKEQNITMAKPYHHFGVADTSLFTNNPNYAII